MIEPPSPVAREHSGAISISVCRLLRSGVLVVAMLNVSGCVAPIVEAHKVGAAPYATVYGTYFFLGFGWGACSVHSIDGEILGFPYPYGAKITPGKHKVTFWCETFFVRASGEGYPTYELNAVAGHAYKLSFLEGGFIDVETGQEIPEQREAAREVAHIESLKLIEKNLPAFAQPLLVNPAYWYPDFDGYNREFFNLAGSGKGGEKGHLVLTEDDLYFFAFQSNGKVRLIAEHEEISDVTQATFGLSRTLVITLSSGRKHGFQLTDKSYDKIAREPADRALEILRKGILK